MTIHENVPLAPLTTLQVGGMARYFAEIRHEDEVHEAVQFARAHNLPIFILGGGSNLVVSDHGWLGLVLRIAIGGIAISETNDAPADEIFFSVGAGLAWDDFVARSVAENCSGVECLSGIPGTVGGTPVQNVGAYGQEVSDTIESVRVFDVEENRIVVLAKTDCGFSYRASIFNTTERGRYIILSVNYRLQRGGSSSLKYADLQKYFAAQIAGKAPTLAETRDAVLAIRHSKGMLLVPGEQESRSAGSFFKNPVLTEAQFQELSACAAAKRIEIPAYPALHAQHKVSAAWLVEHSGFAKGYVNGPAGISRKHALALINLGEAKTADIVRLKDEIQKRVYETWGILLEPEPVFVGF